MKRKNKVKNVKIKSIVKEKIRKDNIMGKRRKDKLMIEIFSNNLVIS